MKSVFTNSMTAHVWAQQTQSEGRNSSKSMSFRGPVAYSYQTAVANILKAVDGTDVALIHTNDWGNATGKHLGLYRNALRSAIPQFIVPNVIHNLYHSDSFVAESHRQNVTYFRDQYTKERDALLRVPADSYRVSDADQTTNTHLMLRRLARYLHDYSAAFGLTEPLLPWKVDADKIIERRDRIMADPKRQAKRAASERARAAKQEREQLAIRMRVEENNKRMREYLTEWRAGGNVPGFWRITDETGGAYLRIQGDKVQTSLGATVPLEHAKRVLKFWRSRVGTTPGAVIEWSADERSNSLSETTLGHFTLNRINSDGSIRAGCHLINRPEIERLEQSLKPAYPQIGAAPLCRVCGSHRDANVHLAQYGYSNHHAYQE